MTDVFCCEAARAEGASLAGTGTRARHWLLVEHRGPWGAQAVEENDLPAHVREWLAAELAALPQSRALLIRRDDRPLGALRCYLGVSDETRRELYRFDVAAAGDLAGLALAQRLAAGELAPFATAERLTLVCTNGRRDRCCARHGVPVMRAIEALASGTVWQSTHQGGHRYAASVLWLPEGVSYGFVEPGDAAALAAARERGEVHRPRFRGRTFHPAAVQAVDALLRDDLAFDALDAASVLDVAESGEGRWRVRLAMGDRRVAALVERRRAEALVSCSPAKVKAVDDFALLDWQEEAP